MNRSALLIIDIQYGAFKEPNPINNGELLLHIINSLIKKARKANIPIFYIQHCGSTGHIFEPNTPGWNIHPAISPNNEDLVITKNTPDSFFGTSLKEELDNRKIHHIIVGGLQTEYCIDTTCRRAFSLGYNVTLVKNGHSTWNSQTLTATQIIEHHNNTLSNWFVSLKEEKEIKFD